MFIQKRNESIEIPIGLIKPNPDQPRKDFNLENLKELSESIKEYGVIQPIIVKKDLNKYVLIAGERRFRAAKLAGYTKIPAILKDLSDTDMALLALIENIQRENLNFIEEALAYKKLMDHYKITQTEIARRVGKQQSTISNKIRLLSLPDEIIKKIADNNLTERRARALLGLDDDKLREIVIERILKASLNVSQTEKLIKALLEKKNEDKKNKKTKRCISYQIYINTVKKAFKSIKEVENEAKYIQEDFGDFMEIKIIIPKKELIVNNRKVG